MLDAFKHEHPFRRDRRARPRVPRPGLRPLSAFRVRRLRRRPASGLPLPRRTTRGARALAPRAVALCFDDAWASVWTAAGPLLKEHGLTAIVYAIPARVSDAA